MADAWLRILWAISWKLRNRKTIDAGSLVMPLLWLVVVCSAAQFCSGAPVGGHIESSPVRQDETHALRTAAAVHRLATDRAARGCAVRLEGVVTHYHERLADGFFLQDETDGVYVKLGPHRPVLKPGDRVCVEGRTDAGDYAPVVRLERWQLLGSAPLPTSEQATVAGLATGRYDSRRITVKGIVRSATIATRNGDSHLALEVRADGQDLVVGVNDYTSSSLHLVDAVVRIQGVAAGIFSRQKQMLAPVVVVGSDRDIEMVEPPQVLEQLPVRSMDSLFRYAPEGIPERRVRLRGVLLGLLPGRRLAVRDATSGVFVACDAERALAAGDQVEVFGFPSNREQTVWILHGEARRIGSGEMPAVVLGGVSELLARPCELGRIEGRLLGAPRLGEGNWVLSLAAQDASFEAFVPAQGSAHPSAWRAGARLAITGITEPYFSADQKRELYPFPRGLRVHARGATDVVLVMPAPWTTQPNATPIVLGVLAGVLVLLGSVSLVALVLARKNAALQEARKELREAQDELARRFSARTGEWQEELAARHAAEADFALLTAERTRLARELHDTLEQSLASVALQLDAARGFYQEQPAESERLLETATQVLRESQAEVRRSVWNLRSVKLEEATLPEALAQLGKALSDTQGPAVCVDIEGTPVALPPWVSSHLFRIAQEAVTNTLKHAKATRIRLLLSFEGETLRLEVSDDGCGFNPVESRKEKRFGLLGLRERAAALRAQLVLDTAPGSGTRVAVVVPVKQLNEH